MAPRVLLFALASLAPFACLANDVDIPAAPQPPPPDPVEEVVVAAPEPRYVAPTLRDRIGRVWAPVYINGKGPYRLVLDTGANRTAIVPSLAKKIGVPAETNVLKVVGATGASVVPAIKVHSIEVGDLFLGDRQVAIVPDVFGGAEGVLGADGLGDKRVNIDFKNDQISILRSTGPVRANGFTRIPVKLRYGHLLMFDVTLAGVRTRAMLDTGAQSTIGNSSLRAALARRKRQGVENIIIGVTLDAQKGETLLAPAVELGDLTLRGMQVTFGDMYIFEAWKMTDTPALLIGMDIIGLLDSLIIDYKRRELHLRAPR
nr:retroviral-like aspartic protease family protein [uncultured Steroidobacter sp.]